MFISHFFVGGQVCDETKRPRTTEVRRHSARPSRCAHRWSTSSSPAVFGPVFVCVLWSQETAHLLRFHV